MTVDAPFVPLRQPEPTLQVQVIQRQISRLATHKKPWPEAGHDLGQVLPMPRLALPEFLAQNLELRLSLSHRAVLRLEDCRDPPHVLDLGLQFRLLRRYRLQPSVDAAG